MAWPPSSYMDDSLRSHFLLPYISALVATVEMGRDGGIYFLENSAGILSDYQQWKHYNQERDNSFDDNMESLMYLLVKLIHLNESSLSNTVGAQSESLSEDLPGIQSKPGREHFHPDVKLQLKNWVRLHPNSSVDDLKELSQAAGLSERQIMEWISNTKKRKTVI